MIIEIYIEDQQLELFESDDISITSSVLDIQDLAKNTTDYSKSFTVPASSVNNRIFKHYYQADIDNTFDARIAVEARIEIGGAIFRKGKILLQKVIVKRGVASSYTINFFGNLVSIKDLLGDDKLADLDLSAYNHSYTSDSVKFLLQGGGTSPSIIYTLLAKKQYYYNSDATDTVMTDNRANIHYKEGTDNGVMWDDLQPAIALYQIINAIETDYGITFSNDFFGRDEFKTLYMWLNNSVDTKIGGETGIFNFNGGDATNINLSTDTGSFYTRGIQGTSFGQYWKLFLNVFPLSGYEDVEYTVNVYIDGSLSQSLTRTGSIFAFQTILNANDYAFSTIDHTFSVYWEIVSTAKFEYTGSCSQQKYVGSSLDSTFITTASGSLSAVVEIDKVIPDLKIIDFLKGIFNAFKLVIIPQDDGTLYVESVDNYYAAGDTIDITNYIDNEQIDVSRGDLLNEITYKFQSPQTILNKTFESNTGTAYGDEISELRDESGKLLDGSKYEIELPFEQIIYERLNDLNGVYDVNILYGAAVDDKLDPANPKAHIFYKQEYRIGGDGIGFINDDETKTRLRGVISAPSHVIDDANPTHSFIFSQEFNEFTGAKITNTLYSNYHANYISNIFNKKRRNFKYKCKKLPVHILLKLSLDDIIKIGYNYYRIDKFTTGLISGETEFNLYNI